MILQFRFDVSALPPHSLVHDPFLLFGATQRVLGVVLMLRFAGAFLAKHRSRCSVDLANYCSISYFDIWCQVLHVHVPLRAYLHE